MCASLKAGMATRPARSTRRVPAPAASSAAAPRATIRPSLTASASVKPLARLRKMRPPERRRSADMSKLSWRAARTSTRLRRALVARYTGLPLMAARLRSGGHRPVRLLEIHADPEPVRAAAEDHAAQRAHIAEVAAPGEHDVLVPHDDVVGGIEADPAMIRSEPRLDPGMRLIGAAPRDATRRGTRAHIARDVARRQAETTQPAD